MKKTISLFAFMALVTLGIQAQESFGGYELGTHRITFQRGEAEHTYEYTNDDFFIKLRNATNQYTNVRMLYNDGSQRVGSNNALIHAFGYKGDTRAPYDTMAGYFDEYIKQFDGWGVRRNVNPHDALMVTLAVDPATGRVMEVEYMITVDNGFDEVRPETYHVITEEIVENISFTINDLGRKFNYLPITFSISLPEVQ